MRAWIAAVILVASPAVAQVTTANQREFLARAQQQSEVLNAMVSAAKNGDQEHFRALLAPGAVYMASHWRTSALSLDDIATRANSCNAQIAMSPEVIGGRVTLPRDKAEIDWQCPQGAAALAGRSVVEFDGMKVAFVRTFDGPSPIVVVAEPK